MESEELKRSVLQAQRGDVRAFEELVREYESLVFRLVALHGPKEEIESIAQESFLAAFRSLSTLREPAAFKSWLSGIALRRCRDEWRRIYRKKREQNIEAEPPQSAGAEAKLLAQEILDGLSPEERMIMTLLYIEERSVAEVAELLHCTGIAVKVRAHRLKKRIAKRV